MGFFSKVTSGLSKSRDKFKDQMYALIGRGPDLDEDFWDELEEVLVLSDVGASAAMDIVERLRTRARKENLPDSYAVLDCLCEELEGSFAKGGDDIFGGSAATVLFVGINGTGKTTTVGKLAKASSDAGRRVILGSADTFRAAAIEQLQVWADRADVEMVMRDRGSDPASVCFETIERAEAVYADLVLIDTAGRLHTSDDLMRELVKVVDVTRKRSGIPVYTVLVIDATTGQNGLQQAREFDCALDLDALIVTKLDGTAKGGIALAISHELELPIVKIGVGEGIDDLRDFDAHDFVRALIGDFDESDLEGEGDDMSSPVVPENDLALEVEPVVELNAAVEGIEACEPAVECLPAEDAACANDEVDSASASMADDATDSADEQLPSDEGANESEKMSWADFVAYDDKLKSEGADKSKKRHFWERW